MTGNPYLPAVHRALPRLLALYNADRTDPLLGCGDRRFWAWKLIDFPNGTFQGAASGLARLIAHDMLPAGISPARIQDRVEAMIRVIPRLTDRHGALAEALPNEASFCVTGLVLNDCLDSLNQLGDRIPEVRRTAHLENLAPLVAFLQKQDEHHGLISNHLASSALGLVRWANATGDERTLERARLWLDRIRSHASTEGWMMEYDGADPGYQSWCTSALVSIETETDAFELEDLIDASHGFLEHFAFPDGSFANGCGARMTRFLFAGGVEGWAHRSDAAARLARFARLHVERQTHAGLDSVDEPNMVPFFNDRVLAATAYRSLPDGPIAAQADVEFPEAGFSIHSGTAGVITVNTRRGWTALARTDGTVMVRADPIASDSDGQVLRPVNGTIVDSEDGQITIEADLEPVQRMLPSPFKFMVLRFLSLTLFRWLSLGNWVKRTLAKVLLHQSGKTKGRVRRRINLVSGTVTDEITSGNARLIEDSSGFSPKHMASQGYWQVQDDSPSET